MWYEDGTWHLRTSTENSEGKKEKLLVFTGSATPGEPYTYRVQAPEFVVEFLNVQADSGKNPANHIHSAWRRLPADFAISE